jgi:RimJ/RimL family protein N-acetyltransferase
VLIRSIRPDDGPRLQEAYARLSPRSRYQRFLAVKPRLTGSDTRYLVGVDGLDHVALVAVDPADPEWIVGVARFVRDQRDRHSAEIAVVVGDPFQGDGLGSALVQRLVAAARERGVDRLTATVLADNAAAKALLRHASVALPRVRRAGVIDELEVELAS